MDIDFRGDNGKSGIFKSFENICCVSAVVMMLNKIPASDVAGEQVAGLGVKVASFKAGTVIA